MGVRARYEDTGEGRMGNIRILQKVAAVLPRVIYYRELSDLTQLGCNVRDRQLTVNEKKYGGILENILR